MKRVLAFALILCMLFSLSAYASDISVSINTVDGFSVNKNLADFDGKNITLDFDVINNSASEDNYHVVVDVTDVSGNKLAGSTLYREFKRGMSAPVTLMASRINEPFVNVSVSVKKELATTYYVSPTGNDNNDGRTPETAIKSVSAIPVLLESLNSDSLYKGQNIDIVLQDGEYNVDSAVAFGEYSSLGDINIKGVNAVISGGRTFKGSDFTLVTDSDKLAMFPQSVHGKIYALNLADYGIDVSTAFKSPYASGNDPMFTTVFYDGQDLTLARYPNAGYANAETFTSTSKVDASFTSSQIKDWKNTQEAWVRGWFAFDWSLDNGRVNFDGNTASFIYWHHGISSSNFSTTNKPWFIYNLPGELDTENEYVFYNNVMYIYPKQADVADSSFKNKRICINTDTTNVLEFTDSDNITLENLIFENSRAVLVKANADNFTIKNCKFTNAQNAVNITGDNNLVYGCDFYNLGGLAVSISGGDRNTLTKANSFVENCTFEHVAQISRTGVGGVNLSGCGVTARNNTFKDIPHSAVSLNGNENVVENNDFSQILTDGSTDAGIIYSGRNITYVGNVVRNNYFHNTNSGMAAIYWDDFLSGYKVEGNVFDTIGGGNGTAVFFHAGVANEFTGNIVLNANIGVRIRGKGTLENGYVTEWNYQKALDADKTPYTLTGYLANVPWQSELWQSKYGHVLKYVDNKTTRIAQDNSSTNNTFINVADEIYSYDAGQSDSHLIQSGNTTLTAIDTATQAKIDSVKNNCGATR